MGLSCPQDFAIVQTVSQGFFIFIAWLDLAAPSKKDHTIDILYQHKNTLSHLIHNERQNIPHDIHLSLSDHVIYGHVRSGHYTRNIENCERASVHKIPWQMHLGKGPPAWIVYEG